MPKISNVYLDKKTKKWYFVASLGYDEKGKRVQQWKRGFSTQKEAKKAYDTFINEYNETAIKTNNVMKYKDFYEIYFVPHYKNSVRNSTYNNRESSMLKHFKFFFNTKIKDISPLMVKKWQNELTNNYSNAYARNIYGMFQMSLDLAVKLGIVNKNIAKHVGNVKKQNKNVDFWTLEEFQKVMATFNKDDYYEHFAFVVIWLLFMTGMRLGEAQALEWEKDISFNDKTISINKTMYYVNANEFSVHEPKTRASNRVIALDNDTINVLEEWKEVQQKNIKAKYILSYNGLPIIKSTISRIIAQHSKQASVHRIKTHSLRHSHASLLISLGENALVIRDRLGHEDIETTLGTYGHLYPNTNMQVAQKLNNLVKLSYDGNTISKKLISNQHIKRNK